MENKLIDDCMKLGFGMMRLPRVEGTNDIDFEQYPEEHCIKAPELLHEGGVGEEMIHAICSHGYGACQRKCL